MHNLVDSAIERQNILNNHVALKEIKKTLNLSGLYWKDEMFFTVEDVATIFQVDSRTIQRCVEQHRDELERNGFLILAGKELNEFRKTVVAVHPQVRYLSLFSFRAVLNLGMLLANSEKAKQMRATILNITVSVLNKCTNGNYTYINQRDPDFLDVSYQNENGRKEFTKAIGQCIDMGAYKYEYFTNEIYQCIFLEKAKEYQKILRLSNRSNLRDTMYTEVLLCITSVESGVAYELQQEYGKIGRKLTKEEADQIIKKLSSHPSMQTFINQARTKMASRDLSFRDAEHLKLKSYIKSVDPEDFERFLGEKSKSLEQQIKEHREIFLRLKDK